MRDMAAYLVLICSRSMGSRLQLDGIDADDGMEIVGQRNFTRLQEAPLCLVQSAGTAYTCYFPTVRGIDVTVSVSIAAVPTPTTYTVQSGTLYIVSPKFRLTVDEVARLND